MLLNKGVKPLACRGRADKGLFKFDRLKEDTLKEEFSSFLNFV
ncbi:hypothetical protein ABID23_001098 [Bartonella silvatica]|uniref:Uncharacterized protein n=1 Tax=Bartonella silvatica TaxID=357760 RepID=A0ABV2HHG6_9HYPH